MADRARGDPLASCSSSRSPTSSSGRRARDQEVRALLRLAGGRGDPDAGRALRRPRVPDRDADHLVRRHPDRGAALDRDRPLPERARAAEHPRPDRLPRRHARRRAERRHRPLGDPRPRRRSCTRTSSRSSTTCSASSRSSGASRAAGRERLHRDARPRDHGDADHLPICRELFINVPRDLEEAAIGLGATRWEMVRGVIVPSARGGMVARCLGLGRALGEAIAVTQVIGGSGRSSSTSSSRGPLASQIANSYSSFLDAQPRLADLPRPDPARDHLHELHRPADRPPLRPAERGLDERPRSRLRCRRPGTRAGACCATGPRSSPRSSPPCSPSPSSRSSSSRCSCGPGRRSASTSSSRGPPTTPTADQRRHRAGDRRHADARS